MASPVPVELESEGATLRGFLHLPEGEGPFPVVAMANGFTATITMTIQRYAETFAEGGIAAMLWDHRNFGCSDGEPRQEINPWMQARGYLSAVDFLTQHPAIDPERVAIWGDSMTGGVVLLVAACDPRVRAVVAQVPACGRTMPPDDPDGERFARLRETLLRGDIEATPETRGGPLPVVSADPRHPALLEPLTAFRWFIEYGARHNSGWQNWGTRAKPPTPEPYHVGLAAPHVTVPVLALVSPDDEMPGANPAVAQAAFDALAGPKERVEIEGGHFGLMFDPSPELEHARRTQLRFLQEQLLG
ncbi:MAG: alpha/beta hydrolase [Sandaracinus sp.]|nr:alpha/beta hydrolase [Sandaracinus sp.]MCB9636438.1 alpha/beta hydrolase [Sandaracinus sp.]